MSDDDDLHRALGRLVVTAGRYDAALLALFREATGSTATDPVELAKDIRAVVGHPVTLHAHMGRTEALIALVMAHGGTRDDVSLIGSHVAGAGYMAQLLRNRAVHDPWVARPDGSFATVPAGAKDGVTELPWVIRTVELYELASDFLEGPVAEMVRRLTCPKA